MAIKVRNMCHQKWPSSAHGREQKMTTVVHKQKRPPMQQRDPCRRDQHLIFLPATSLDTNKIATPQNAPKPGATATHNDDTNHCSVTKMTFTAGVHNADYHHADRAPSWCSVKHFSWKRKWKWLVVKREKPGFDLGLWNVMHNLGLWFRILIYPNTNWCWYIRF